MNKHYTYHIDENINNEGFKTNIRHYHNTKSLFDFDTCDIPNKRKNCHLVDSELTFKLMSKELIDELNKINYPIIHLKTTNYYGNI